MLLQNHKELALLRPVARRARGKAVRRTQEWLCLNGHAVAVDGAFGPATEAAVQTFCEAQDLTFEGKVDQTIFDRLSEPMQRPLEKPEDLPDEFGAVVVDIARRHLQEHPREVGGQNRGPWVRLYMNGREGSEWPWCAGFVSFVIRQACVELNRPVPFPATYSCDILAHYGRERELFVGERDVNPLNAADRLPPGTVFLNRRVSSDWTHAGFVVEARDETFATIEGNTNDEGSREGYEVCARTRGYGKKDFVRLLR